MRAGRERYSIILNGYDSHVAFSSRLKWLIPTRGALLGFVLLFAGAELFIWNDTRVTRKPAENTTSHPGATTGPAAPASQAAISPPTTHSWSYQSLATTMPTSVEWNMVITTPTSLEWTKMRELAVVRLPGAQPTYLCPATQPSTMPIP